MPGPSGPPNRPRGDDADSNNDASVEEAILKVYAACEEMTRKRYSYKYGGGHTKVGTPTGGGYDCSSSVCTVLAKGGLGYRIGGPVDDSGDMATGWGEAGKGTLLTLYANDGHVFLVFDIPGKSGRHFGTGDWGKGWTGPGFNPQMHPTEGFTARRWTGTPSGSGGGTANDVAGTEATLAQIAGTAKATSFATFISLPGIMDTAESLALRGEKSLLNDQPLMPFVQQLCQASLRNFQSLPDGGFFAFYPDYFGGLNHRTPYWDIEDIEILDANMQLSDDPLATHVYVVGDIANFDGVNIIDKIQTGGVVSVFQAFQSNFLSDNFKPADKQTIKDDPYFHGSSAGKSPDDADVEEEKEAGTPSDDAKAALDQTLSFLRKYGARPYFEEAPMVRSPYFEAFLAYQKFMLMWSRQFVTEFSFTYMPELFPGGIVAFPSQGVQCYIDSVEHIADMEQGFTTKAKLSAPAAINRGDGQRTGRLKAHEGMIRAGSLQLKTVE